MKNEKENENALKHMYDQAHLKRMGVAMKKAWPKFDSAALEALSKNFDALEMKPRVRAIRDELKRQLPSDYPKALAILMKAVESKKLSSFDYWPFSEFIQSHGLDHLEESLEALQKLAVVFTSEWAIRPYLTHHQRPTLKFLERAAKHSHTSVRRWASEGSRPRLPWGERLGAFVKDPKYTSRILDTLKYDDELFVRKSVANHLNDIAKDHPDYVVKVLTDWNAGAPQRHRSKIQWITRHALRSLIKAGHPGALKLLGVDPNIRVTLENLDVKPKKLHFGESLKFDFRLTLKEKSSHKLVVDYVIDFVKANGNTAPKVFKLKTVQLVPGQTVAISKSHAIRKITTRDYFPGKHSISIQVNGKVVGKADWYLKT